MAKKQEAKPRQKPVMVRKDYLSSPSSPTTVQLSMVFTIRSMGTVISKEVLSSLMEDITDQIVEFYDEDGECILTGVGELKEVK